MFCIWNSKDLITYAMPPPTPATRKRNQGRDYRKEYNDYYGTSPATANTLQKKHRKQKSSRNMARAIMKRKCAVCKTQDIDHKDGNPLNNNPSNLRVESQSTNRARNAKKT